MPAITMYFLMTRKRKWVGFYSYLLITLVALNITTAIMHFDGWLRFFSFNQERGIDLGSPWYATSLLGFDLTKYVSPNLVTLLLILAALLSAWRIWSKKIRLGEPIDSQSAFGLLTLFSFLSLAFLFSINKVYSPQYVLWLTPLALMAIDSGVGYWRGRRVWFWIWQIGEAIYHLAIWQYLVEYSGGSGLSATLYALTILIRIASLWVFANRLYRARLSLPSRGS